MDGSEEHNRDARNSPFGDPPPSNPYVGITGRRRRIPSPQEHARRQEWGRKWGKLVADGYRELEKRMV